MALFAHPRKPKKGQKQYWHVRFRIPTGERDKHGKLKYTNWEHSIGSRAKLTKAQAEEIHDKFKLKFKKGYLIVSPVLASFATEYIKHKRDVENKRSWTRDVYSIRQLSDFFGYLTKLEEITPKKIDDYKAARIKKAKPATVNRELECLRNMINLAVKWKQFEGDNPVTVSGTLKEIRKEPIPLSYEEEDKLLPVLNPSVRRISEFDLNTGMRIGEIINLELPSVDFKRNIAKLEATEQKGKKTREVPLNQTAIDLIHEACAERKNLKSRSKKIFLNTKGEPYRSPSAIYKAVLRGCKQVGIKRKIYPHLFRHTFITRAMESGLVDPITVKEIVGHADLKVLLRYVHLKESKIRAVNSVMRNKNKGKNAA